MNIPPLGFDNLIWRTQADDEEKPKRQYPDLCNNRAVKIIHWPTGSRLVLCRKHYLKAIAIAKAMGFLITQESVMDETLVCTQEIKKTKGG